MSSADELRATAARIVTAKKRFNILAGWTPAEDTLPDRMLRQPLPEDARAQLSPERLNNLVQAYNRARGWTEEGWLPGEKMNAQSFVARHETTTSSRSVHVELVSGAKINPTECGTID